MSVKICTCCRVEHTALHAHEKRCEIHDLSPVVPHGDCTAPMLKSLILDVYRTRGGVALALALKLYGESE